MENVIEDEITITEIKNLFNDVDKLQKELELELEKTLKINDDIFGYDLLKKNKDIKHNIINSLNVD